MSSNACRVLSQCNTRVTRLLYLLDIFHIYFRYISSYFLFSYRLIILKKKKTRYITIVLKTRGILELIIPQGNIKDEIFPSQHTEMDRIYCSDKQVHSFSSTALHTKLLLHFKSTEQFLNLKTRELVTIVLRHSSETEPRPGEK